MTKPLAKKTSPASPKPSVLAALEKLDADQAKIAEARAKLVAGAREELLAQGQTVLAGLKSLGYAYVLIEAGKKSHHKQVTGASRGRPKIPKKICPVCGFSTRPPHDARTHRHVPEKKAFTATELQERGLVRL